MANLIYLPAGEQNRSCGDRVPWPLVEERTIGGYRSQKSPKLQKQCDHGTRHVWVPSLDVDLSWIGQRIERRS